MTATPSVSAVRGQMRYKHGLPLAKEERRGVFYFLIFIFSIFFYIFFIFFYLFLLYFYIFLF